MSAASAFLQHPDALTREVARGYAGGAFLMDNGEGMQWYSVAGRALVPLTEADGLHVARRLRREVPHFEVRVDTALTRCWRAAGAGCRALRPATASGSAPS
jgi:leucyl/phenylalanyl-tRNA--protein transferase